MTEGNFSEMPTREVASNAGDTDRGRQRAMREILETACPDEFKSRRMRNMVFRAVRKTRTEEFATKLNTVLVAVGQVATLEKQLASHNAHLVRAERRGTLAREHNSALAHLQSSWKSLIDMV